MNTTNPQETEIITGTGDINTETEAQSATPNNILPPLEQPTAAPLFDPSTPYEKAIATYLEAHASDALKRKICEAKRRRGTASTPASTTSPNRRKKRLRTDAPWLPTKWFTAGPSTISRTSGKSPRSAKPKPSHTQRTSEVSPNGCTSEQPQLRAFEQLHEKML